MAMAMSPPEPRILLDHITWEMYESLLQAHGDRRVPRFTDDRGQLEMMRPSIAHEELKDTVTLLVNTLAEEMGITAEVSGTRARGKRARFPPPCCNSAPTPARGLAGRGPPCRDGSRTRGTRRH